MKGTTIGWVGKITRENPDIEIHLLKSVMPRLPIILDITDKSEIVKNIPISVQKHPRRIPSGPYRMCLVFSGHKLIMNTWNIQRSN